VPKLPVIDIVDFIIAKARYSAHISTSSYNIKGVTGNAKHNPVNAFVHIIILYANSGEMFTNALTKILCFAQDDTTTVEQH